MKKLSIICLLFILSLSFTKGQAQTSQSVPTREDAVALLKTVLTIAEPKLQAMWHANIANVELELNECILKFAYNSLKDGQIHSYVEYQIDLSKIKAYKDNSTNGYGTFSFLALEQLRQNSVTEIFQSEGKTYTPYNDEKTISSMLCCINDDIPIIKENHYLDRALKALNFLIKGCGGGVVTVDSNSKF